jgi:predicted ATP-dependent endonuclease of OLD family
MGKKLEDVVKGFIKDEHVRQINTSLNGFIDKVSKRLGCYEYKKPAKKQNLFNQSHLASKVIEAYFDSKVLTLKQGAMSIPVYGLSSGEKRRALIDIAKAFLAEYLETGGRKVILAIDEPEISLDLVSRLDQFEKLREISVSGVQVLITTHWYGFMPVVSDGTVTCVHSVDSKPFHMIDLRCFRDDVKKLKKETNGAFPLEIELRGINELVQSVIASITGDDRRWLICEGVSDQIYLQHFFGDIEGVVVLPIGASKNVKKFYEYLLLALDDDRESVKGRVFMLLDTDKKAESFDAKEGVGWISIRRLLNDKQTGVTKLLKTTDNSFYPPTEIEDVLDSELFLSTLIKVAEDNGMNYFSEKFNCFDIKDSRLPSGLAFDFRDSDRELLENFFEQRGFKIKFALAYVKSDSERKIPSWFNDAAEFLFPKPTTGITKKQKAVKNQVKNLTPSENSLIID